MAEAGYVSFLHMYRDLAAGDWGAAAEKAEAAVDAGRRHGDRDLVALGLVATGRIAIYSGRAAEGLARLDEAMAAVAAGEVSPEVFGNVYCIAIEGCQEISALDRVVEWTSALSRWCDSNAGLVAFTGQCSVHRGQVMRQHGAWTEALAEFTRAGERYRIVKSLDAIGQAEGERGDVLRLLGQYDDAEAAYQGAGEHGFDPQPGLALLWLARGSHDAAAAAVRRLVAEAGDPPGKCRMLPGCRRRTARRRGGRRGAHRRRRAGPARDERRVGRAAGAVGVRLRRRGARRRRSLGRAPVLAQGAPALDAAGVPVRDRAGPHPHRPGTVCPRRRGVGPPGARRCLAPPSATSAPSPPTRPWPLSWNRPPCPAGLTAREVEVLRLVASGRSNPQIAADLTLSEKTVARHLSNIFGKLDVGSRTAAAAYAFEHGLV